MGKGVMQPPTMFCKVLLVTGGQKSDFTKTASTELLSEASSMWTLAQPLPSGRSGLGIAHVEGRILAIGDLSPHSNNLIILIKRITLCIGGWNGSDIFDSVLELDTFSMEWRQVGSTLVPRTWHAVSEVSYWQIQEYCH